MTKKKDQPEPEVLTAKPAPSVCEECKSQDMTCCEVVLNKNYRVYYTKCGKCHEVEVYKISKEKSG
jgi:hypothetical protein